MRLRVALASRNAGKLREIRAILERAGIDVVLPGPEWQAPEETEPDYRGNALLKARSLSAHVGIPTIADDSGIEVDLLGGAPGPRSARFAGDHADDEQNLQKLLDAVSDAAAGRRTARYRCVAVLVTPEGREHEAEGTIEGRLILERRGTGGFGYDPIFVPDGHDRTMAELDPQEKDAISHRGKAFRALLPALRALAGKREQD